VTRSETSNIEFPTFETATSGKWILAGEHTGLRGGRALVFPLRGSVMRFRWQSDHEPLTVEFKGTRGHELNLVFFGLLEEALKQVGRTRNDVAGHLLIESDLRLGAGLGASAALCVGAARFLKAIGLASDIEIGSFARKLENLFHGESSGVDIAVADQGRPLVFTRSHGFEPLNLGWQPRWTISYSGKRGVTAECVKKVKDLWTQNPRKGQAIDDRMSQAVELAFKALEKKDPAVGLPELAESVDLARSCFADWGLIDTPVARHMSRLTEMGALAVKPTGSGGGGYVLAVWGPSGPPRDQSDLELIPV